jgi:hypothetical protein
MNRSIAHQDRSGAAGLPLIVIDRNGVEIPVPAGDDPSGFAEKHGYQALNRCLNHPDVPAVDCTTCVPLED